AKETRPDGDCAREEASAAGAFAARQEVSNRQSDLLPDVLLGHEREEIRERQFPCLDEVHQRIFQTLQGAADELLCELAGVLGIVGVLRKYLRSPEGERALRCIAAPDGRLYRARTLDCVVDALV